MDGFKKWLEKEISEQEATLKETSSVYPGEVLNELKRSIETNKYALKNYKRIKGYEPCEKVMDYRETQGYLLDCRNTIEYLKSYVIDKITMDEQDKQLLTNPNALHDIKDLIEGHMR